jgi:hypothetical protein|tara:strand:- start:41 stop:358 length:318 start_codon:yes stop_codon:yes gene_type:complete
MPVITKNQNRFRKVYPGIRKNSVNQVMYTKKIEAGSILLTDSYQGTYTFELGYLEIPSVTATVYDTTATGAGNTNVIISDVTRTSVTIQTSQAITGTIYVQVVEL